MFDREALRKIVMLTESLDWLIPSVLDENSEERREVTK